MKDKTELAPVIFIIGIIGFLAGATIQKIKEDNKRKNECHEYGGYYLDNKCWLLMEPIKLKGDSN